MKINGRVRLADLASISQEEYEKAVLICSKVRAIEEERSNYVKNHNIDPEVAFPAANWGEGSGNDFLDAYRFIAINPTYKVINHLRFYTQFFTGYNLKTLSPAPGHTSVSDIPDNLDEILDKTCPEPDLWVHRYIEMMRKTPVDLRVNVPKMLGEIGWDVSGITVSHDLYVYQERLNLLYESGVIDELSRKVREKGSVTIVEIGGGFGGLANLIRQVIPQVNYFICDLPESLLFSSLYLSLVFPNHQHTIYDGADSEILIKNDLGFKFIPNFMFDDLKTVDLQVDLAINTLSFSEMSEKQVRCYAESIRHLLKDSGVLFEQNQDNRSVGLIYCKEYITDYFTNRETLKTISIPGITQGIKSFL
ncbi:MAG: putative sugar O-methyltransferase [Pseudanabaenaceae cyanobacterium bins.39]|nr:putative sugar O-methyltransferase [Pseudanabaenaceae cyanobacterium bins.39]